MEKKDNNIEEEKERKLKLVDEDSILTKTKSILKQGNKAQEIPSYVKLQ